MGVRFLGIGREAARSDRRRRDAHANVNEQLSAYNNVLDMLRSRSQEADRRSGMSVRDLFGRQIDRRTDNIRANANATKSNISRLGLARGGDPSGASAVTMNRIDEGANKQVGNIEGFYQDRALQEQNRSRSRGDQLIRLLMGGRGNLLDFANRNYQGEINRNLQRKQANKQFGADIFSTLVSGAATVATGGAGGG